MTLHVPLFARITTSARDARGHLWQNRFFACMLAPDHLWAVLAYGERAGRVRHAADYRWSSAASYLTGGHASGMFDGQVLAPIHRAFTPPVQAVPLFRFSFFLAAVFARLRLAG